MHSVMSCLFQLISVGYMVFPTLWMKKRVGVGCVGGPLTAIYWCIVFDFMNSPAEGSLFNGGQAVFFDRLFQEILKDGIRDTYPPG